MFLDGHLPFAGGVLLHVFLASRRGRISGELDLWSDLICSGTWRWLGLLRHGWPGSPAGSWGWSPRALPRAGPVGIALCQTWAGKTRAQLGSQEHGVFRQLWGFTQIACPSLEDTTCVKFTLGRKWKNKSGLIKIKKKKKILKTNCVVFSAHHLHRSRGDVLDSYCDLNGSESKLKADIYQCWGQDLDKWTVVPTAKPDNVVKFVP